MKVFKSVYGVVCALLVSVCVPSESSAQEMDLEGARIYGEVTQRSVESAYVFDSGVFLGGRLDWRSRSLGVVGGYARRMFDNEKHYRIKLLGEGVLEVLAPPDGVLASGLSMSVLNEWYWGVWVMNLGGEVGGKVALDAPFQGVWRYGGVWSVTRVWLGEHTAGVVLKAGQERAPGGEVLWGRAGLIYRF